MATVMAAAQRWIAQVGHLSPFVQNIQLAGSIFWTGEWPIKDHHRHAEGQTEMGRNLGEGVSEAVGREGVVLDRFGGPA